MLKLKATNLDTLSGVAHAFFGRKGGVSTSIYASLNCGPGSGDDRANVVENRRRAVASLGASDSRLATLYQMHGATAVRVTEPWEIGHAPRADASVTNHPGVALGILTADCAPVLFADAEARVVGAAHAGWKGARAGVVESALAAMEELGARRDRIVAAIGPCITQPAYEVGAELRARVLDDDPAGVRFFIPSDREDHWRFDLPGYVRHRLRQAGVQDISDLPLCTYAQEAAFFSYRRATHHGEADYGRQLSAIMLI